LKLIALYAVACVVLLIPSAAQAEPDHGVRFVVDEKVTVKSKTAGRPSIKALLPDITALTKQAWKVDLDVLRSQQHKSATVVAFFNGDGEWLRAIRHEKCWEVPWQRSCTIARATHRLHTELLRISTRRLLYEIPMTSNWTRAMRYAQRPFPGTYDFLEFTSTRECRACYTTTRFICNYQGSGACGPLQFMEGTFYGHMDDARAWLKGHGFIVPDSAWTWSSQLGQALVGAYMKYTDQEGCHWCP